MVINSYLPHLIEEAESLKKGKKTPKLFTPSKGGYGYYGDRPRLWTSVSLDHPATFEILTMELAILDDHDRFVKRRHFYRKVGKAWKRGYLLYGPPGTGKSSLVAAMANYLKFDIYNLELTDVFSNSELRKLLVATANRSNLVVEDFNCSIEFHHPGTKSNEGLTDEEKKIICYTIHDVLSHLMFDGIFFDMQQQHPEVTLSKMLNFLEGLWSSCSDERIIVFTTNHKERLDPALLCLGPMDVHVLTSYCPPCRQLASNYLNLTDHILFGDIEDLLKTAEVTPAEIAEQLLRGGDKPGYGT
ncbi:protein HYPER-SENSITIVITY-RELATED 4-like [Punica granatum]|uniref:Protein HYPER-SENSITIVITY-RELATED 4-like n=1 Tax=Punica granatum TaxID=22663 RepID=A0A6P8EB87_PUNGR|nr:protein HYPER-SENSITIVITY-RELATED 4-like [Punica granatum]